ncbi:Beta-lactamase family protein [uncultured Alphaproteobacteria bacterium]|uniref:Beta-lactamase family protein n=1 Tax=uncultured Alphaproteobacteria bacterium TaxID=91750 RepID=A0A212J0X3_9PROT|nr:Beta-lactamase family protein [uncultured Alphaproteobacteria bacterium]
MSGLRALTWGLALLLPSVASATSLDLVTPADDFLKESGAPGVEVSVLERGKDRPQTLARGFACVENSVPMRADSVMKLGSVTKVFTGLRIRMLIEEGKLAEDAPLSRFVPEQVRGDEITVRHLLTHTSGLPEMLGLEPFASNMAHPWTPREIAAVIAKQPLDFAPGSAQRYSNSNYLMLGRIVEIVTGEPFDREIRQRIATPLGMRHLSMGDDETVVRKAACGYAGGKPGELKRPMMASLVPPMATGNLIGTSEDIVRLVNQGRVLRHNLIDSPPQGPWRLADGSPAVKPQHGPDQGLEFDQSLLEGMTLFRFDDRPLSLVGKAGMFPGFAAWFLYDPQTRTAVAVTTNLETKSMEAMRLGVRVLEAQRRAKAVR